jgi:hypothetical protein
MNGKAPFRLLLALFLLGATVSPAQTKPRVIVLTDISNEPDDEQSMVRLLCYANELDLEALVATTSCWLRDRTAPEKIVGTIEAYRKVRDNLMMHAREWPTADLLLGLVATGVSEFGMEGVGADHDSEGSERIIRSVDRDDPRPVYVSVWGGANCLAQSLWKVKQTRTETELDRFVAKLRVYAISDQDNSGPWMRNTFPNLFFIVTPGFHDGNGDAYHFATWSGISGDKFHGRFQGADFSIVDNPWLDKNIRQNHGPLGAMYPQTEYLMEGDTPSSFWLIPNGLNEAEHPNWGGWGGRYELYTAPPRRYYYESETRPIWTNAMDEVKGVDGRWYTSNHATIWRWRKGYQHDFAARIDWSNTSRREDANHHPEIVVDGDKTRRPILITAAPGSEVSLDASGTVDPDGNSISYHWYPYREVGTFPIRLDRGNFQIRDGNTALAKFTAPKVDSAQTLHVILEVQDDADPSLTSYRRVIVTIDPEAGHESVKAR